AAVNGDIQMAVLMLEAGADVNAVAEDGGTALQLAASYKHGGVVDLLLKWKADPNLSAPLMSTVALWEAAKTGNTAAAKHLLGAGVDVNAVNDCSDTALSCAVLRGYENFVKLLLDRGADWKVGRNLVTIAVSRQHLNIARELLNRGARPS
ncbi:ankyrin repeat-containing domain protein, partial [Leptodontidium sp. 2 PMI_412]